MPPVAAWLRPVVPRRLEHQHSPLPDVDPRRLVGRGVAEEREERAGDAAMRDHHGVAGEIGEERRDAPGEHGVAFALRRHEAPLVDVAGAGAARIALADLLTGQALPDAEREL